MTLTESQKIFEDRCDEIQSKFATGEITFDEAKADIERESYEDMARTLKIIGLKEQEVNRECCNEYWEHHI